MEKIWKYIPIDSSQTTKLKETLQVNPILIDLLVQKGIYSFKDAKKFFRPDLSELHDPYLMKDMEKAVTRIIAAIEQNQKILIYGDYDVDGTTSVALLMLFLTDITPLVDFYIPNRYEEGYGISKKGIDYAKKNNISLMISIDCGITAIDEVAYASTFDIDFIICDHHLPSENLPQALAILDPKQADCNYPYKELSGCGVGFKLCTALATKLDMPKKTYLQYIDLVTVSIASDIVPITGENRTIAYFGLEKLNANPTLGLRILKDISGFKDKNLTISDIVFSIGPKINAPGRMENANASVEILKCSSIDEGYDIAKTLNLHNTNRRETDMQIMGEAVLELEEIDNEKANSIVFYNPSWSKGVIGIVASRLVEKYYKPTIIFSEKDKVLTGSARSIKGFSIYEGIKQCKEYVIQFGGHDFAAGLTIQQDNFEKFKKKFDAIAKKDIKKEDRLPMIEINKDISFSDITMKFYNLLLQMSPFGPENMQPVFSTTKISDTGYSRRVGSNNSHLKLDMKDENGFRMKGIAFGLGDNIDMDKLKNNTFDICYSIQLNHFRDNTTIDLFIKDIKWSTP